jgi:DNA (cytosine-5)-methyltransferase 1
MENHKFNYKWKLSDSYPASGIKYHGKSVFSTFACGGGSTMGYKLAGYNHLGGVEIDNKLSKVYKVNHTPKYFYNMDIRKFNKLDNLPECLYNLDLLDGSPPCTTFSINGKREKLWKKEKNFREGQKLQCLDDLVYIYCNTIIKLRPKVFLLENVKGLTKGNAKIYLKNIVNKLSNAGYITQVFLLNAKYMGVPQARERVFVIGHCNNYNLPKLKLCFNERPILFGTYRSNKGIEISKDKLKKLIALRNKSDRGLDTISKRILNKVALWNYAFIFDDKVCNTIPARCQLIRYYDGMKLSFSDILITSTFPSDYNFLNYNNDNKIFIMGMSVPPVMISQIAHQIYLQWLSKI